MNRTGYFEILVAIAGRFLGLLGPSDGTDSSGPITPPPGDQDGAFSAAFSSAFDSVRSE